MDTSHMQGRPRREKRFFQNFAMLTGVVSDVPTSKTLGLGNQNAVTDFTIGTAQEYIDKKNETRLTWTYHKVRVFGARAVEAYANLRQGDWVSVRGSRVQKTWKDSSGTQHKEDFLSVSNIDY